MHHSFTVPICIIHSRQEDSNAPVEGPIPLEPEEKLDGYRRDDSKVRQL